MPTSPRFMSKALSSESEVYRRLMAIAGGVPSADFLRRWKTREAVAVSQGRETALKKETYFISLLQHSTGRTTALQDNLSYEDAVICEYRMVVRNGEYVKGKGLCTLTIKNSEGHIFSEIHCDDGKIKSMSPVDLNKLFEGFDTHQLPAVATFHKPPSELDKARQSIRVAAKKAFK